MMQPWPMSPNMIPNRNGNVIIVNTAEINGNVIIVNTAGINGNVIILIILELTGTL